MFWGLFSALLASTSTILYRLAIKEWPYGRSSFVIVANWVGTLMGIGALIWLSKDWIGQITWLPAIVFCALMVSIYHNGNRILEINRTEKVSTLQIFGNISTILTLVVGFLLFGKTSLITLGIAILCGVIVFVSQFDGHAFHPPKEWKKISMTMAVGAINGLVIVWLIEQITSIGYFVASSIAATLVAVVMLVIKGKLKEVTLGTRNFYIYRATDGVTFNTVRFIHFFLIGSLGPVVTTLLGMLGNIVTLIFSAIFLGEKNSAKEWGVNILLCILVGVGFYFK